MGKLIQFPLHKKIDQQEQQYPEVDNLLSSLRKITAAVHDYQSKLNALKAELDKADRTPDEYFCDRY